MFNSAIKTILTPNKLWDLNYEGLMLTIWHKAHCLKPVRKSWTFEVVYRTHSNKLVGYYCGACMVMFG